MLCASDSTGYVWFHFLSVTFTHTEWLRFNIQDYFPLGGEKNKRGRKIHRKSLELPWA